MQMTALIQAWLLTSSRPVLLLSNRAVGTGLLSHPVALLSKASLFPELCCSLLKMPFLCSFQETELCGIKITAKI